MRFSKLITLFCLIFSSLVNGQVGTEFWFAAPDISFTHTKKCCGGDSKPLFIHVTALYNTHVTISRPSDPTFIPYEFDLNAQQSQQIRIDDNPAFGNLTIGEIETMAMDASHANFVQNKGFLIEASPGEITAYYEPSAPPNSDIVALKAANALGKEFWVSTQRKYKNHGYSDDFSGFTVVATKDGTVVDVDPRGNNLEHHGTTPFQVTLNKGECFAVQAAGQAPDDHIFGIHVTSNKDIAIVIYDDSMQMTTTGGNWDIFADQLVPKDVVGLEYIALRGWVQDKAGETEDGEAVFVTPTEDNTDIFINGVLAAAGLMAGQYFEYTIDINDLTTHIRGSKPIYVNHISGYADDKDYTRDNAARELGGAILPPIDKCTGSYSVTVKRTPATKHKFYFNNLLVRNDTVTGSPTKNKAIHNFTYSINNGVPVQINPNHFTYIMDSAFAVYDRSKAQALNHKAYYENVLDGQLLRVDNSVGRFHLGTIQASKSPGCKYGYFSDFANSAPDAGIGGFTQGESELFCSLNPIQMVAGGGTAYKWTTPFDPTLIDRISFDTVAAPIFYPDSTGIYYFDVEITGECYTSVKLPLEIIIMEATLASFSFSNDDDCSPFAPILFNQTDTIVAPNQVWIVKPAVGNAYEISQDTIPRNYNLSLPLNKTDSIQVHTVELIVDNNNACPSKQSKEFKVRPEIKASFLPTDTIGCHPFTISFTNNSSGNLDSTSYYWDFGDNTQSFDSIPTKTYTNYTLYDTTHTVTLVTDSPFGCTDTARKDIVVHPRIKVNVAVDSTSSCSPLISNLSPASSFGADTLWWNIDYFYSDSVHKTTSLTPITLTHFDTSTAAGPDTLYVQLIGSNRMGCMDTATTRQLISYPDVIADFTIDKSIVCDSVPITFTNNSTGYKLKYDWDFGNNTYNQDSTSQSYTKAFYNRTGADTIYTITLEATSGYFCSDVMDTTILVHPYVKADFGISYENNCSPLNALITNTSIRSQINQWDFGTGTYDTIAVASFGRKFINPFPDKDTTLTIQLVVRNSEGCFDTLARQLPLFPQVVSDFEFTTDSVGCAPLTVGFNNKSTGGNLYYTWDFGDNSSSSSGAANFNKTFNNVTDLDTTFMVSLTVKNLMGCDSIITRPVNVFAFVDAEFNLPVTDSCSPFVIRPDNLSSQGAKVFEWDFGNGETSTLPNPVVPAYIEQDEVIGNYNVRLIAAGASDPAHLACADTHIVPVTIYPELEADIILADTANCQPLMSAITNNTNIIPNTSFTWYIDQKFYSSDPTPPDLIQNNFQPYDTNLTVYLYGRSEHGCRDTAKQEIYVYSNLDAFFSVAPSSICSADSFQIDQTYTNGGISYRSWDFFGEDTANTTTNRFYHVFENLSSSAPVEKEITLTVYNDHNCSDTWKDTVVVYPKVTADFDPDFAAICYPHNTQFTNNSTNADRAYWTFGDGASSIETAPAHLYNNFSPVDDVTYNVTLTASSNYNCFDTLTKQVKIYAKPNSDFFFPVSVACPPFTAEMINNSLGSNLDYFWDFAGEGTSTDPDPTYTFSNSGSEIDNRDITLRVVSDRACSDTLLKTISVYPDVNVDFEVSINNGCSPLEVTFTGDTTNTLNMLWYIDGKAFSTIKDPSYRFLNETPGNKIHDIKFEAWSLYECSADTTKQVTIFPAPVAEFIPRPLPADYGTEEDQTPITFSNETVFQDSWSYEWNYGDGNVNNETTAIFDHVYGAYIWGANDNGNKIPVQLVAWNTANPECRDTVAHDVIIYPPIPQIDLAEDISGCQPFTVDFSATTKYIDETDYLWEFNDGNATSTDPEPTYTFTEPGNYTVKLIVKGDGGTNWDYKIVTVNPKPQIDFTYNDSIVFDSSMTKGYDWINFYNHSKFASADEYQWYFDAAMNLGGVPDSREKDPAWYYTEVGIYDVGLIAGSGDGCYDTLVIKEAIRVETHGYVTFPTAFFVNPDGPSDEYDTKGRNKYVFYPLNDGIAEYQLEIYNRWGARVFNSNDPERGWNGYVDGAPAKQDVYIYRARGVYTNGQPFDVSGDVTLIHGRENANQ
jgi:PKD repeat protein